MITRLSLDEWIDFDKAHPAPTFFARPAWAMALADAYPALEITPLLVGKENRVLVPATSTRNRLGFRELVAFPLGTYTAFLDEHGEPVPAARATSTLNTLRRAYERVQLVLWPLGPQVRSNKRIGRELHTAVVDCTGGFERATASMRGVTRRMAGQALRRGVTCRNAPVGEVLSYDHMLRETLAADQHKPAYALLEAVLRRGGDDAQLWFAEADGKKIAGGIVLYGSKELFFWSAAMRREYSRLRPSNALNVRLLEEACKRGVAWYNLGASEGLAGVEAFKHNLGAGDQMYQEVTMRNPLFTLYQQLRSRVQVQWGE